MKRLKPGPTTKEQVLIAVGWGVVLLVGFGVYYRNCIAPARVIAQYGHVQSGWDYHAYAKDEPYCWVRITKQGMSRDQQAELMNAIYRYNRHCSKKITKLDFGTMSCDAETISTIHWLTELRSLSLSGPALHGDVLLPLRRLPKLKELNISSPAFDDADLATYVIADDSGIDAHRFEIQQVSLRRCAISNEGVAALSTLRGLVSLDISETNVNGTGLLALNDNRLEELTLSGTDIDNQSLAPLVDFPHLIRIDARNTAVTGDVWKGLRVRNPERDLSWGRVDIHYTAADENGEVADRVFAFPIETRKTRRWLIF